ncbi:Anthranilate synthase component I [Flavobacterium indicum GPTSA100-9 = DSM 17447]|uniref:Anthranilate synthase component 1 n=1 Tax=Flavobacterium indicum (strain DSM 17447 / CIP 109464 / GPTSA100-9) TaxID=1094466 RepID=H8XQW7_FLAIG|nr:anthranilate synthase component I family protein [Flavobacterium indicum]CCG53415.1 Anthranilate synthase component I [Flavobacterium indicum GPTSA100-9 = DSM 17447]
MKNYKLHSTTKKIVADTLTPVSIYLKIRDKFPNSILLESSDYHAKDNSFSFICCQPMAFFKLENSKITIEFLGEIVEEKMINPNQAMAELDRFKNQFTVQSNADFQINGLFGYMSYDAVQYFEKIAIHSKSDENSIPEMYYALYQTCIAINHFKNEAYIVTISENENVYNSEIEQLLQTKNFATFSFARNGDLHSNLEDNDFKERVNLAKRHCKRGDVFQLVLSRRFEQEFKGDEFNVYRALRSINPSPYLFYFDYGNFKLFGSSPEAQIKITDSIAEIHPIAGTFKRTGNDEQDALLAKKLAEDEKENSEHVMLVDLARNDLSRNCSDVTIEKYKEVQFFSHVIHLVSKVTGKLKHKNALQVVAETFPAGTLSGAPKVKAMQLIEEIETTNRSFYGGAVGFLDFNGNFNHAIMIRTFLSKNHTLYFQAGAGIVERSSEENELQEVYNKLNALNKALEVAETI